MKIDKQYGVYYTPREIVHYMCQQSLINYLHTETSTFDFEVYFSEVFHHKGGFDVVIANPPYLESRH